MAPKGENRMSKLHLVLSDRIKIEGMLNNGCNFAEIGRAVGKNRSTISREVQNHCVEKKHGGFNRRFNDCVLRTNCPRFDECDREHCKRRSCTNCKYWCGRSCPSYKQEICKSLLAVPYVCNACKKRGQCTLTKAYYEACSAEEQYKKELTESRRGISMTEKEARDMQALILPLVQQGQSLQVINMSNTEAIGKSTKTLYSYVNAGVFPEIKNVDLPRKVIYKKRKKKADISYKRDRSYREGRKKEDFDEFLKENPTVQVVEMDTLEGPKNEKRCLLTLLFLNCTVQLAFLRETNSSETTTQVWNLLRSKLTTDEVKQLFPVVLTDNGTEFTKPEEIEENEYGEILTRVFYCHPLASWEKGDCENNHAHIRRILPKGSSFSNLTQQKVDLMMNHINSYPRPQYNGKTPYEMFVFFYGQELAEKLGLKNINKNDVTLKPYLLK